MSVLEDGQHASLARLVMFDPVAASGGHVWSGLHQPADRRPRHGRRRTGPPEGPVGWECRQDLRTSGDWDDDEVEASSYGRHAASARSCKYTSLHIAEPTEFGPLRGAASSRT